MLPQEATQAILSEEDWSQICAAHRSESYSAQFTGKGVQAHNPGQDWSAIFDGRGVRVQPNKGGWSWGLRLQAIGFGDDFKRMEGTAAIGADGRRIVYDWSPNLQEWFINDERGLEHGYTLRERPSSGSQVGARLNLELSVLGSLSGEILPSGLGIRFVDPKGRVVLTYDGLRVFDANGMDQPALFTGQGTTIGICIDEARAQYPLTIDPIAQQAYLKASNTDSHDRFGGAVAISGNTVVVGARHEDSNSTTINGDQNDNTGYEHGAAYVFERVGGVWVQQAYLKSPVPTPSGIPTWFGYSVAISGDTIVVGELKNRNAGPNTGAAHVFERNTGSWSCTGTLNASNMQNYDFFGCSVAVSGDRVVVGAYAEDSNSNVVNSGGMDNSAYRSGAAYVYGKAAGTWTEQAYLKARNSDEFDMFGISVSISGDAVLVGAWMEDGGAAGVDGNHLDNSMPAAGAAYVFRFNGTVWRQEAYIKASNPGVNDGFGRSVAIWGDTLAIGAAYEDGSGTGVGASQAQDAATDSGAVYLFQFAGGSWSQESYVKSSDTGAGDYFGFAVALSEDRLVVGVPGEDGDSNGVNGGPNDDLGSSGCAHMFEYIGGHWHQEAYIKPSNPGALDMFGQAVAVSADGIAIGAPFEDGSAMGVNGPTNELRRDSGAAYVFVLDAPQANYCGTAVPNSSGASGTMSMTGSVDVADNDFTLHASALPINQFGYFINSMGQGFVSMPGGSQGNLCLGGGHPLGRHNRPSEVGFSGVSGSIDLGVDLNNFPTSAGPHAVLAGETWNFQCWFRDSNPSSASNFTDGLSVLFE